MRLFCLLTVSLFILSSFVTNASLFASDPIRVLSINVRLSTANDGVNSWANRRDFMTSIIVDGNYDFIGTQETIVHPDPELNQVTFIAERLPGHGVYGRSREVNPEFGEAMTIFYKRDRWKMDETDHETFWVSDTPDVPGSMVASAGNTRTVTAALFHEHKDGQLTGRSVYVYNTHLDHRSEAARRQGAKMLMDRIANRKNQDAPVIAMGDINSGEQSFAVRYIKGETITEDGQTWTPPYRLLSTFRERHPDATDVGTFNGFREPGRHGEAKIDYVFVSPGMTTLAAEIIRTHRDGLFPTDHFPVDAEVMW